MSPGPTKVRENVRISRSLETTNPDLDPDFFDFYKETCECISQLLHTNNTTYILSGEGILALEAACASLIEPNDQVLVLDNGVYGKGFAEFISLYQGIPTTYSFDYTKEIPISELEQYLIKNHDFKFATIVHCDTPSGVLNNIEAISNLLHQYGILTIVDAVSSMFGESIHMDRGNIDILCGGSQKVLSAPPGLCFVTLSAAAQKSMESRTTPILAYYCNLFVFKDYYENQWFPYTMPISDIYGLRCAIDNIKDDPEIICRHKKIGEATRNAITSAGLELFLQNGYSNTVSVIKVPEKISSTDLIDTMKSTYHILIAGSFDVMLGKVIRIGHMGENCNINDMKITLNALTQTLYSFNYPLKGNLGDLFLEFYQK